MKKRWIFVAVFLPLLGLALFLRTFTSSVVAKPQMVEVGGMLTEDTVWTAVNSPYVLTSSIQIPAGITLTVEPGVTVFGQGINGIIVQGKIVAVGTDTSPVTFTSLADSAPGEWAGFFFWDGSGHFENAVIKYGGYPINGYPLSGTNVNVAGLAGSEGVTIRNSIIQGSNGFGMFVPISYLDSLHLENVTFTQNITDRVRMTAAFGSTITTNVTLSANPGLEGYEFEYGGLIVADGILTLEPGTALLSPPESGIILEGGHLTAVGTPEKPITFTSNTDSATDRWGGLFFWDGSAELVNTRIRFAGEDVGQQAVSALHVYEVPAGKDVVVENSIIYGSGGYAIAVEVDNLHQLHMQNNQFINNAMNRILLLPDIDGGDGSLVGSVSLPGQEGLESYELLAPGLIVPGGVTLTMGADATLMSASGVGVQINGGHLDVMGTETAPVQFTSVADSGPGEWLGLRFVDGTAVFNHAELRFADDNLVVSNTAVSLQNTHIHDANNNGLQIQGGAVTADCTTFNNNGNAGVSVTNDATPNLMITNSNIYGNTNFGLFSVYVDQVDARNNWWGDPTGPAGIGPGGGDAIQGNVLFSPWQTEATCLTSYLLYLPNVVTP